MCCPCVESGPPKQRVPEAAQLPPEPVSKRVPPPRALDGRGSSAGRPGVRRGGSRVRGQCSLRGPLGWASRLGPTARAGHRVMDPATCSCLLPPEPGPDPTGQPWCQPKQLVALGGPMGAGWLGGQPPGVTSACRPHDDTGCLGETVRKRARSPMAHPPHRSHREWETRTPFGRPSPAAPCRGPVPRHPPALRAPSASAVLASPCSHELVLWFMCTFDKIEVQFIQCNYIVPFQMHSQWHLTPLSAVLPPPPSGSRTFLLPQRKPVPTGCHSVSPTPQPPPPWHPPVNVLSLDLAVPGDEIMQHVISASGSFRSASSFRGSSTSWPGSVPGSSLRVRTAPRRGFPWASQGRVARPPRTQAGLRLFGELRSEPALARHRVRRGRSSRSPRCTGRQVLSPTPLGRTQPSVWPWGPGSCSRPSRMREGPCPGAAGGGGGVLNL